MNMKLHTNTLISALTKAHGKGFKLQARIGTEWKTITAKAVFPKRDEIEYRAIKGKELKLEEYRGIIFVDGDSRSVLPTGGCKGTGKARRMGAVQLVRALYTKHNPQTRREAIELATGQGFNKFTASRQFQEWRKLGAEESED